MELIKNSKIILNDSFDFENTVLIEKLIESHKTIVTNRFKQLERYYEGKHKILDRTIGDPDKPNNKGVANFCQYATDQLTGFFMGKPVSYSSTNKSYLDKLNEIFKDNDESSENHTLAHKSSIKGQAFELVYADEDGDIKFTDLDTDSVICVYDNTVQQKTLMAIRYFTNKDILSDSEKTIIDVYTKDTIYHYEKVKDEITYINEETHYFGEVPIIEFANNRFRTSDFEGIITLNDMYNLNLADISNDIAYFSNCLLALEGMDGTNEEDIKLLKENRTLLLPENAKAYYITKQLNDSAVQNHRNNLKEDIHKFSYIPDLSEIGNVSNISGTAIKQKFFSTEQVIQNKERMFKKALMKRIKLISNFLNIKEYNFNSNDIEIQFNRNLPINLVEFSDSVVKLAGTIPNEILFETLNKYGLEIDVERAIELKKQEENFDPYKDNSIPNGDINE